MPEVATFDHIGVQQLCCCLCQAYLAGQGCQLGSWYCLDQGCGRGSCLTESMALPRPGSVLMSVAHETIKDHADAGCVD